MSVICPFCRVTGVALGLAGQEFMVAALNRRLNNRSVLCVLCPPLPANYSQVLWTKTAPWDTCDADNLGAELRHRGSSRGVEKGVDRQQMNCVSLRTNFW